MKYIEFQLAIISLPFLLLASCRKSDEPTRSVKL